MRKTRDENVGYYDSLKPGDIVHYDNGFENYVRCRVVIASGEDGHDEKRLMPIAMVGPWSPYDLPQRRENGRVNSPYYPSMIASGGTFHPHCSAIYEFRGQTRLKKLDPRKLEPLSLEAPPLSHQMLEDVPYVVAIKRINEIGQSDAPPREKVLAIHAVIAAMPMFCATLEEVPQVGAC